MRKPIIAGNWKMNLSIAEGVQFVADIKEAVKDTEVEVVLCAPFTFLKDMVEAAKGTNIRIAAQNMHFEKSGAFTGEISADMLKEVGVSHVVIGHSERRQYFAETDQTVNLKVKAALAAGLIPIMCIGETLEEREAGKTKDVCNVQTVDGLKDISAEDMKKIVIAYEPVWAIGTGRTASAQDANDVIAYIRSVLAGLYGEEVSEEVRIQYGGSVKPENVEEIMNEADIDGALVGGASVKADSFISLVNF